ncbi:MAG: hypothetical protein Q4F31_07810 [Eubacteriales bacterium]|nr:hypothetical protein [Eubacteriales bacterium]
MKKRQIFIELTSLLDVILIMLFMILMQARTQTNSAMAEAEEVKASVDAIKQELTDAQLKYEQELSEVQLKYEEVNNEYASLQNSYGILERQIITDNLVIDNSLVITVSIEADGSIRMETTGKQPVSIPYDWNDETYAENSLKAEANNRIQQSSEETVFYIFQYDRSKIYEKEYNLICNSVERIKQSAKEYGKWVNYIEIDVSSNKYSA